MTKRKSICRDEIAKEEDLMETLNPRVYVFHNTFFNFNLFINAENADEAMEKFDMCGMMHRDHWKIFIELKEQPTESKH